MKPNIFCNDINDANYGIDCKKTFANIPSL